MKITILGSTGLLGNAVGEYFLNHFNQEDIYLSYRNEAIAYGKNKFHYDPLVDTFEKIPTSDYIINCIGIIKPFVPGNELTTIKINSVFPLELANYCEKNNIKLLHITTDCVFSGKEGHYNETALHDCLDAYGKSKSLGEPTNCMALRTSIIGEEIHNNASLIEWAKLNKNQSVNGFTNHLWNGITTKQYAKICEKIIKNNLFKKDLFHLFSNDITKHDLLTLISEKFSLNLDIKPTEAPESVDRTLSTNKSLCKMLEIPSIETQIDKI